ncbi:MAG: TniQ family protein [Cyanobacterium sp. T60_A2020_053]|nr:TniQ family protein [Cyanobacterium sp. T60_A2020_053]
MMEIQPWWFTISPYEDESISHFLGRFRRENTLTVSGLGEITGLYSAIARWEKFRFNPSPSLEQLEKLSAIVQVDVATLQKMCPSAPMKMSPIRLCSACYVENPYHRMKWQYKEIYKCDRHQLKLLSECPHCGARFKIPSLWVNGWCHRCFTHFGEM